jgi:hypothetical protein
MASAKIGSFVRADAGLKPATVSCENPAVRAAHGEIGMRPFKTMVTLLNVNPSAKTPRHSRTNRGRAGRLTATNATPSNHINTTGRAPSCGRKKGSAHAGCQVRTSCTAVAHAAARESRRGASSLRWMYPQDPQAGPCACRGCPGRRVAPIDLVE